MVANLGLILIDYRWSHRWPAVYLSMSTVEQKLRMPPQWFTGGLRLVDNQPGENPSIPKRYLKLIPIYNFAFVPVRSTTDHEQNHLVQFILPCDRSISGRVVRGSRITEQRTRRVTQLYESCLLLYHKLHQGKTQLQSVTTYRFHKRIRTRLVLLASGLIIS